MSGRPGHETCDFFRFTKQSLQKEMYRKREVEKARREAKARKAGRTQLFSAVRLLVTVSCGI